MTATATKPARRWYSVRWWCVALLIIIIPMVWYLQHQIRGERALARVLALWDAEGRWRWEDMLADRPAVADEGNLSLFMKQMVGTYSDSTIYLDADNLLFESLETHPQHLLADDAIAVLQRRRKDAAGFFELLPRFRVMPGKGVLGIQFKGDAWSSLLHIQEHRNVTNRLHDQFQLELMNGRMAEAFALLQDQMKVAASLQHEPSLICYLVQIAIRAVVIQDIQHWLAMGEPDEASLQKMQQSLTEFDSAEQWRRIIMAEAGSNYSVLVRIRQDPSLLDKLFELYPKGHWWEDPLAWARAFYTSQQIRSPWQHAALMQWMLEAYQQTYQPLAVQYRFFQEKAEKHQEDRKKGIHSLTNYFAPAYEKVFHARKKLIASTRCAQVALAAERFRRANQRWPNSQAELVGKYLPEVQIDPFDDQPLRYKLLPDGVVVYSVASVKPTDVTDDGGDVLTHDNVDRDRPKDLGIRLWNVEQRRQPARPKPKEEKAVELTVPVEEK